MPIKSLTRHQKQPWKASTAYYINNFRYPWDNLKSPCYYQRGDFNMTFTGLVYQLPLFEPPNSTSQRARIDRADEPESTEPTSQYCRAVRA
ncbi:uncharacterized protein ANIA_11359 [Aspergillus nidulans FGSC A4]|uniref:Uncharacterized protein n=1 Tax=Emericella nidulans (strain FGSC A4 / ATCC 38163 / CBS 112.46 / NRRL 194 / M139) TaxID=227321 RepID=C8VKF0_EMENI|nr:hypothetical protein [Aspergillus nidulans FGSC A4]CBF84241.1 TPA: hypothetical protein ANIA_11359 [Aspergillus nidulans FGSC A4]